MNNEPMTNDKSLPAMLGLLFVAILLVACAGELPILNLSDGGTETASTADSLATPSSPSQTTLPDDATTATRINARGFLRVGVRYDLPPFGYVTEEGEVTGFDVDLGRELARRWLGDRQAVQFRQVRSDTAIEHLQAGDVDIVIAALTHAQGWEAGADFSLPYFVDGQALLVRGADVAAIGGPADLAGRPVGVARWGEAREALEGTAPFTLTFQTYDRFDAAVAALGQGELDTVAELRRRLFWGKRMLAEKGIETAIVGQYTAIPVALAFPQNEPFFADLINLTLQEMVADGVYADLYTLWFAESPPAIERWPGEGVPVLADAPIVASAPDTVAAIQSRGRLVVALPHDRSPFAYVDATGAPAGYEVGLVRLMTEHWMGDATALDFITTTIESGQEMLRTGQVDLLVGGLVHSRAAELELDYSLTTYVAGEGLLVQAGTPITNVTSLSGRQVAVIRESGSREILLVAAQDAGVSLTVLPQPTLEAAIALLAAGQVAAVAGERSDLLGPAYATPGLGVLPLRLTQTPLALGLPPGDSAFRDLVNLTLQAMEAEGQFDALYAAWFDDTPPLLEVWPGAPYRTLRLETAVTP
jgi:polar amino acid transport system substrate-binding protein